MSDAPVTPTAAPSAVAVLRQRWQALATREQQAVRGLAVFTGVMAAYLLLWQPPQQALARAEQAFNQQSRLQQQLHSLPAQPRVSSKAISGEALPGLITRTSRQAQLNLERVDNSPSGHIDLSLEGPLAPFIGWLAELEQQQVKVLSLSLEVSPDARARAQLQLSGS